MSFKELLIHRIRDFDSVFRLKRKFLTFIFIIIRQFSKILHIKKEVLIRLVKDNQSFLYGHKFLTRKKTLDFLFFSKYYEPETTKFLLSHKGNSFFDIGSHVGRFAILLSSNFKKGYAFEPHPENYSQLIKNKSINNISNLSCINAGLSNSKGHLYMNSLESNTGAPELSKKGKFKVNITTLDSFLEKNKILPSQIDLVLIDTEKHEFSVLNGARSFLKKTKATIIIECFEIKKLEKFMSKFGYKKIKCLDFYNWVFVKE